MQLKAWFHRSNGALSFYVFQGRKWEVCGMESAIISGYVPPGKSLVQHGDVQVASLFLLCSRPPFFTTLMLGDSHVKDRG